MLRTALLVFLLAAANLSACSAFRTPYVRPDIKTPATYAHVGTDQRTVASLDHWWESFQDPNLNALVREALSKNPDLALAALNIKAASYQTHLAVINPAVAVGYTHEASKPLNTGGPTSQFHSLTASASYEIDLWGQLAAERDATRWEERATQEDREAAAVLLVGSVVNLYFEIAQLNEAIDWGEANIADAQRSLSLTKILRNAGGATALDVASAEQSLEAQRSAVTQLQEQRVEARNGLTVLLDGTPWPQSAERSSLPDAPPPTVQAGIPASLLERRPDLKAAELRLRETLAQTDATRLSFYPILSLTGSVGTASTGLSELVSNPLGSLAATISAPFVQWNQAHFATQLARTQYDEAVLHFKKSLWQALFDVDNALSASSKLQAEGASLERSLRDAERIERLTAVRYRAGSVSLQIYLAAQASRREAELSVAGNRMARLQNYATLCQALGGGGRL